MSSGSTTATRASISGLRSLSFTLCSGDASTALRVTSEPVPEVVGTATLTDIDGGTTTLTRSARDGSTTKRTSKAISKN